MNLEYLRLKEELVFNWFETLFIGSIEKVVGKKIDKVRLDYYKQEFIKRFFVHFLSVKKLYSGVEITYNKKRNQLLLLSAVLTLIRSCLENLSTFNYIYTDTQDFEELEYRFWSWWREGLINRQRYYTEDEESKKKQAIEKEQIEDIYNKMVKTKCFNQLSKKQKEKYKKYGKWHDLSYKGLLSKTGFSDVFANNIYNYLSSYSHPTSTRLLQTSQLDYATAANMQKIMINALFIASALYLHKYKRLFKEIESILSDKDKVFIDSWCELGEKILNPINTI